MKTGLVASVWAKRMTEAKFVFMSLTFKINYSDLTNMMSHEREPSQRRKALTLRW